MILFLPATGYLLVKNQNIQNYLVHELSELFSEKLNAHFAVKSAHYTLFNKLVLEDVFIEDQRGDSLIYSKKITGNLKFLDLRNRELYFKNLSLDSAIIHLKNDTSRDINVKFLIEALRRKDTTKPKMHIRSNDIEINQSLVTYHTNIPEKNEYGIDFNHLVLRNFNLRARNLNADSGRINLDLKRLSFKTNSGLDVLGFHSGIELNKKNLAIRNLMVRTPHSFLQTDSIVIQHDNYNNFNNPVSRMKMDIGIKESNIGFSDLAYFSRSFLNLPGQNFAISGSIDGTVNNLKGDSVFIGMGRQSELLTDFSLTGLPDISKTFMYINVNHLYTGVSDLDLINKLLRKKGKLVLPQKFQNLGRIEYKGNFTGFIDDFVAYGKFFTNLGELSTDLLIQPKKTEGLALNGNLKTRNFNIGGLVENEKHFGNLSMDIQVQGSIFPEKEFQANTDGEIKKLEINGYNYKNIKLDGLLTDKKYDGALSIEDPNVEFDFHGGIDFSKELPVFDFNAHLKKAKLSMLNIVQQDTTAQLSFNLVSNFRGNTLDDAIGTISLKKGELIRKNKKLNFENLQIQAKQAKDTHKITLKSDYVNAELVGQYKSTTIYQSLKNLAFSYLPSLQSNKYTRKEVEAKNDFDLKIALNNTTPITDIFTTEVNLEDSSQVHLSYNENEESFRLTAMSNGFSYENYYINDPELISQSQDTIFSLVFRFDDLTMKKEKESEYFHHFELKSLTGKNKSKTMITWNHPESKNTKGELIALLDFSRSEISNNLRSNIFLLPGNIDINNKQWQLSQSYINIDSSSITFNDLKFYHQDQSIVADGKITQNARDTMRLNFSDITLDFVNLFFPKGNVKFNGIINGNARFTNLYNKPTFHSDLIIDTLLFNDKKLGNTTILTQWNNEKEEIRMDIESKRGNLKTLDIDGEYTPSNQRLEFGINLDKISMAGLNPILQKSFSDFNGALSGYLTLTGTGKHPVFNGKLFAHKTSFKIDYLQTSYSFTHTLDITDNQINFNEVTVTDKVGNQAQVVGHLHFNTIKNVDYNFNIDANQLRGLNTSGLDNNTYYGEAYASGLVNIQGNSQTKELNIEASLQSEDHTLINLPIGDRGKSQKTQFITFVDNQNSKEQSNKQEKFKSNLSGINLNFDLEVTPQAQTRLIFDPELRDIIEANGRGNLNMDVNNNGDFRIYGNYTIEDGTYLFSLKNVINKKFEIEQGSEIIWNGEPQDADINVTAVYNVRTSLNNLFMDTTEFYNKRIPVDCKIVLSGKLINPDINFEIDLPTADESIRARVKGAINSSEELNKQFLSLIVLNTFMPSQQYLAGQSEPFELEATSMTFTTSELLSNQLSHWLSQISNNWDVGVNYQPGDEISKNQVEVALSTQLLNDRLIINGNVGTSGKYQQASEFVGDFRVDWKLTPNGKLRLKFFNRNSDRLIYEETRYIQGAGLFYREEFNTFRELFKNIAQKLSSKTRKEQEKNN